MEEGIDTAKKLYLCNTLDHTMQIPLTNRVFVKRELLKNGKSNILEISDYSNIDSEPNDGWTQVGKSDAIIISSSLLIYYGWSKQNIKLYFDLKRIRNMQAHNNIVPKISITIDMVNDMYHKIIYPVITSTK